MAVSRLPLQMPIDCGSTGPQMSWLIYHGLNASKDSLRFRNADVGKSIITAQAILTDGDSATSRAPTECGVASPAGFDVTLQTI